MTTTNIYETDFSYTTYPIKGGTKLGFAMLVAFTAEGYLVPIDHSEAVSFAGITSPHLLDDPELDAQIEAQLYDNSNGQDGDLRTSVSDTNCYGFVIDALTAPLNLTMKNRGQVIFASNTNTLHTTAGEGRFPIGRLRYIGLARDGSGEIEGAKNCYWIDPTQLSPVNEA